MTGATPAMIDDFIAALAPGEAERLVHAWPLWARQAQLPPPGPWRVWLLMAGRGFGKTRAGAEWVRWLAETGQAASIALVGDTADDVRHVMVEGPSGLLALAPSSARPLWQRSLQRPASARKHRPSHRPSHRPNHRPQNRRRNKPRNAMPENDNQGGDLVRLLTRHEGRRAFPYTDTAGRLTIGVGRNLTDRGLADDEIDHLLANDIALAKSICEDLFGTAFTAACPARRHALISMAFNLGGPRLAGFTRLRDAVRRGDWDAAAGEALDSRWAAQTGRRAIDIAAMLRGTSG